MHKMFVMCTSTFLYINMYRNTTDVHKIIMENFYSLKMFYRLKGKFQQDIDVMWKLS